MMAVSTPDYKSFVVSSREVRGTIAVMRRSTLRRMVGWGLVLGAAYVVWRVVDADHRAAELGPSDEPRPARPAAPTPAPAAPGPASAPPAPNGSVPSDERSWVEPEERACPASHPVKAKLASGIYHEPSGANYDRTVPDRCYRDGPAAQRDGLRRSKR